MAIITYKRGRKAASLLEKEGRAAADHSEFGLFQPYSQDFMRAGNKKDLYDALLSAWYIGFAVGQAKVYAYNVVIKRRTKAHRPNKKKVR